MHKLLIPWQPMLSLSDQEMFDVRELLSTVCVEQLICVSKINQRHLHIQTYTNINMKIFESHTINVRVLNQWEYNTET